MSARQEFIGRPHIKNIWIWNVFLRHFFTVDMRAISQPENRRIRFTRAYRLFDKWWGNICERYMFIQIEEALCAAAQTHVEYVWDVKLAVTCFSFVNFCVWETKCEYIDGRPPFTENIYFFFWFKSMLFLNVTVEFICACACYTLPGNESIPATLEGARARRTGKYLSEEKKYETVWTNFFV